MTISAGMVKELREKTGAGMMDCKKALSEENGDIEKAVEWLRKKGLSSAAKKSGRAAAEGLVGVATEGTRGAIVEINAETDFVSRNTDFQDFVRDTASIALSSSSSDKTSIEGADYPGAGKSVSEQLTSLIATIGENMVFRRNDALSVDNGTVVSYIHGATADGLGRIGVLVALESTGDASALQQLGKNLAMHVAATGPQAANVEDLDSAIVDAERKMYEAQAKESGKPEAVIEKIIEGRIRKFYEQVVFVEQDFVMDPDHKVKDVVEKTAKEIGAPIQVKGFVRFTLGEGVEKEEKDFAAEVAEQLGQ
ncbi:MAG: translation elongation factor Ts [Alphaproteobacteria bacterium]